MVPIQQGSCVFTGRSHLLARPSERRSSPWPVPPRPPVPPLWIHRLCFLSFSTLWQILARTDARAAKCIVLSQSDLPVPTPQKLLHKQGAGDWGVGGGRGWGAYANSDKLTCLALCTLGDVCIDGWMDSARLTAGQREVQVPSPRPFL